MNILLDTHILLWWLTDDKKLKKKARDIISNPKNNIYISSATAWEISIKKSLGKLTAPNDLENAIQQCGFNSLNIQMNHAKKAGELPRHHHDPFDRMLIAQAEIENFTLITQDTLLGKYHSEILLT